MSVSLPPTQTRVEKNSPEDANRKVAQATLESVRRYENRPGPEIARRLEELDREWDIERALEMNAAALALVGAVLALVLHSAFALLSIVVTAFLLQHALQGWCPPIPIFRRRGFRTAREIYREKTALRILRGDFKPAPGAEEALAQVGDN